MMTSEQAIECADILTGAYPNTAGKAEVRQAYSRHLLSFPYFTTASALHKLSETHKGDFCPSVHEMLDELVRDYTSRFWAEVNDLADRIYPTRYLPGEPMHAFHFRYWYRQRVPEPSEAAMLEALRNGVAPAELLAQVHPRPLGPREGGPMRPPVGKDP